MTRPLRALALLVVVVLAPNGAAASGVHVVVRKAQRRLLVLRQDDSIVRDFPVGLGLEPIGPKLREGDRKTPEGDYFVTHRNPESRFFLSFGISYPNEHDADRGLASGIITPEQHAAIVRAARTRSRPPQDTPLGGDIFIHGNGSGLDWTWGCIALDDEDVAALDGTLIAGTPIRIEP